MPNLVLNINPEGSGTITDTGTDDNHILTAVDSSNYTFNNWTVNGYTQLEYIQSSGTQYIDTGVILTKGNSKIEGKYQKITAASTSVFGSFQGGSPWTYLEYSNHLYLGGTDLGTKSSTGNDIILSWETVDTTYNLLINGTESTGSFSGNFDTYSFKLFASGNTGNYKSISKIYYFKIYNEGQLVRDFIPVIRHSDNAVGMLDLVHFKFYGNSGTGTFIDGPVKE